MSSTMKVSLLALISTAAAVPHYGGHSRFHHKPSGGYGAPSVGAPMYPTGALNSTRPFPTASGAQGEKTTTLDETQTSIKTLMSTIYVSGQPAPSSAAPSSVGAADVSSGSAGCGPATVTVTASQKVTITVPYGGASSAVASSSAAEAASSTAELTSTVVVTPTGGYEAPQESEAPEEPESFVLPSSSAAEATSAPAVSAPAPSSSAVKSEYPVLSISLPNKPVETPSASEADYASSVVATSAAPSSSAPASTGSPSYSGGKRGLAYNEANLCDTFAGKAAWAYNWASAPAGSLPEGVKFVPLAWTKNEDASKWLEKVDEAVSSGSDVVMGFNEPDMPSQANMSPEEACKHWQDYMNPVAENHSKVTILGPSVSNSGTEGQGLSWLQQFQDACPQATWHDANIHFYDIYQEGEGEAGTVGRFVAQIEKAAEQTGKKVWITEFGLNAGSASSEQTAKFLKGALEYMDGSDKVGGYSYFMVGTGENQLNTGNGLSAVGKAYVGA